MIPKSELISNGIQLSHIAIGTHTFCRNNEKEAHAILDEFVLNGGNVIDTARSYGGDVANPSHEPESESCIGSWLKTRGIRNKIILMTKGGNPEFKSGKLVKHRINEQSIETDITKSLEKLNTDYIDIYFLHKDDPNIEEGARDVEENGVYVDEDYGNRLFNLAINTVLFDIEKLLDF